MSDSSRRPLPPPRPYGTRPRPLVGRPPLRPPIGGSGAASAGLGGALGAIGGTLGCLLCLSAIGALGLFACVIAITAYTKQFLNAYRRAEQINGAGQLEMAVILLFASLFYTIICRIQRS